jgi:uncharacterized protein DUF2550
VTEVLALIAGWALLLVLAAAVIAAAGLASRRILLGRAGGTVECGLRATRTASWRLGLASYQRDELYWFSAFGLRLRPDEVFERSSLCVVGRRPAGEAEAVSIGAGTVVVECRTGGDHEGPATGTGTAVPPRTVELAMSEGALTGFLAWLESAPPGYLTSLGG